MKNDSKSITLHREIRGFEVSPSICKYREKGVNPEKDALKGSAF